MGIEVILVAVVLLIGFAILDLMVGVSNDAVNFLNSAIGSRVASRRTIMIIASLGILVGVTFSSNMMEVARKGIFHPQLFNMPELIAIFLAVMIADVILLDLFNTYGLPTSTTVSIVFELLGAAVVVSLLKIAEAGDSFGTLVDYINTTKAIAIISGILLSVVVAFVCGAFVQFLTRLIFTYDYARKMKRYGAIWAGMAMASITWFILVKGAKGASFITADTATWIKANGLMIMGAIFAGSFLIFQVLLIRGKNILKPVILVGTFALALAFAANDLVNFIGVPLAGMNAYQAAILTPDPLTSPMSALAGKVASQTWLLLIAGGVMVGTLWISRKARTVTETEISLGRQEEGEERFGSTYLSRAVVRMAINGGQFVRRLTPGPIMRMVDSRMDTREVEQAEEDAQRPSFDLLRASVNLMVASAVVSYATSNKLPLSTTYVTFMVAMGTSFADKAWGRESAVYRVTGVLTVIGGWFITAFMAFTLAGLFAMLIRTLGMFGIIVLLAIAGVMTWRSYRTHKSREKQKSEQAIFNLKKVTDTSQTVATTFHQMSFLIREINQSLNICLEALFRYDIDLLHKERKRTREIERWTGIISANVFKAMRLLQQTDSDHSFQYAQTVRRLQKLADGHRDMVHRAHVHTSNHHSGLLQEQITELQEVKTLLAAILAETEALLTKTSPGDLTALQSRDSELRELAGRLNKIQAARVQSHASKTRLSILYYSILGNAMMLSKQNLRLLEIFNRSFSQTIDETDFDMD
jgi:phosphate/sulfate permease